MQRDSSAMPKLSGIAWVSGVFSMIDFSAIVACFTRDSISRFQWAWEGFTKTRLCLTHRGYQQSCRIVGKVRHFVTPHNVTGLIRSAASPMPRLASIKVINAANGKTLTFSSTTSPIMITDPCHVTDSGQFSCFIITTNG